MELYNITLRPESSFGTLLKGDTLFGHFCWQAAMKDDLLQQGFDHWISRYLEKPFVVFSSAWPQVTHSDGKTFYYLPRPSMPVQFPNSMSRQERAEQRKIEKSNKWLQVYADSLDNIGACRTVNDRTVFDHVLKAASEDNVHELQDLSDSQKKPILYHNRPHNSINRLTLTTGKGFDPYTLNEFHYLPGIKLVVFVAIDPDSMDVNGLHLGMERIGNSGFGRDSSTGAGRFRVEKIEQMEWPDWQQGQGCYTLAPCVPEPNHYRSQFVLPFTRFGRHGAGLATSKNPFKNPVVMADEGAIFFPEPSIILKKPYIGMGLRGLSLVEKNTVAQGYSLYLPLNRSDV